MGSSSTGILDEAHCLWALCSHSSCWQAEQRIRTGKPRMVKAPNSIRAQATISEGDRFPMLSVVNASEWTDIRKPFEVFSPTTEDDHVSKDATCILISQPSSPREVTRQEKVQKLSQSSSGRAHLETNREKKTVKLRPIQMSPLASSSSMSRFSEAIVMWVPSSCHSLPHNSQQSVKSPQLAVKKLICPPSAELDRSSDKKKRTKQDTSKRRVLWQQKHSTSQLNHERKRSQRSEMDIDPGLAQPSPDHDLQLEKTSASPQDHHLVPVDQTVAPAPVSKDGPQPPRSAHALLLRNKPVVFHPSWERMHRRHTRDDHHVCKYKVDMKTGVDGIDWQSLKRQTYLWRKHSEAPNYEFRRGSSSEDNAGYVPDSLSSILKPKPALHDQAQNLSTTGPDKWCCMDCMKEMWQSYSRALASKSSLLRTDNYKFWFAPRYRLKPGQATGQNDHDATQLDNKGTITPPNSEQSSKASPQ